MSLHHSKYVLGSYRVPSAQDAGDVVAVRYEVAYNPAVYAAGDILELGILPAHHTVWDMVVDANDLDTATGFSFDIGLMDGDVGEELNGSSPRTCGQDFFAGGTIGQSAGVARMNKESGFRVVPTDKDRAIGVKFVGAGTTPGIFGVTVFYGT
jgi:hypothetical protein